MREIQAPHRLDVVKGKKIFLGGSIEMGVAEQWQNRLLAHFQQKEVVFLNPRRADWDSSWVQEISNPHFKEQVDWELNALDLADVIIFYFDPKTKSPVTLMELGLYAATGKCVVCCPPGFWRKGNVDIVCRRYHVNTCESFADLIKEIEQKI